MNRNFLGLFKKRKLELLIMAYTFLRWRLKETRDRRVGVVFIIFKKMKFGCLNFRVGGLGFG